MNSQHTVNFDMTVEISFADEKDLPFGPYAESKSDTYQKMYLPKDATFRTIKLTAEKGAKKVMDKMVETSRQQNVEMKYTWVVVKISFKGGALPEENYDRKITDHLKDGDTCIISVNRFTSRRYSCCTIV
mmetsp:Transcript_5498/g.7319  ORF Transcript_5498/g.7319 Transcript_5498/m.7319 type:complete len:130 (+) Transcript_5498:76-465(+)